MPGVHEEVGETRKRKHSDPPRHEANKKKAAGLAPIEEFQSELQVLEERIKESRKNFNNIGKLLQYVRDEDALKSRLAMATTCRIFFHLMAEGKFTKSRDDTSHDAVIAQWLRERLGEYRAILLQHIRSAVPEMNKVSLDLFMLLMKEEAAHLYLEEDDLWTPGLFSKVFGAVIESEGGKQIRIFFIDHYARKYGDVLYHTYSTLRDPLPQATPSYEIGRQIAFLSELGHDLTDKMEFETLVDKTSKKLRAKYAARSIKNRAGDAWLSLLGRDLDKNQRKTLLGLICLNIAPCVQRLERLMDFLTDSFEIGGSTSLLALSGLYYLIREKNLDYPQFYQKLYSLLDSMVLHSKHRSRFLRLLDTFLSSTHLPAALIASFMKRMARLCLHSPPSGIAVIVPWIYNLLKGHTTCTFMIHRRDLGEASDKYESERLESHDVFRMNEKDPMETGAIDSSLWEIEILQSHYHPNIATICKIISEQFTKQAYNLEDFLDHSYASMLDSELSKDMKKPPVIEYEIPKKIFHIKEDASHVNIVERLWEFNP